MPTYSAAQLQATLGRIANFQALAIQSTLIDTQLKQAGTDLYNDPILLGQWPSDGAAIRAILAAANGPITTFLATNVTIPLPVS